MKRILICGDRNWTNSQLILRTLINLNVKDIEVVIEGACRGADRLGAAAAGYLGIDVLEYPADWIKYGRSAGPIRNRQMLKESKPNLVLAFHNDIEHSKGTADMVKIAKQAKIEVQIVTEFSKVRDDM